MLASGRMAYFANIGPTLGQHGYWLHDQYILTSLDQHWPNEGLPTKTQTAEVGPTVGQWWIFIQDGGEQ